MDSEPLLSIDKVSVQFGALAAVDNVEVSIGTGEIVGIVGPNGAGKTSLLNCIVGLYPAARGEVRFDGIDITKFSPHQIVGLGISRTFQHVELVDGLTVAENLLLALEFSWNDLYGWSFVHFGPRVRREMKAKKQVAATLEDLGLTPVTNRAIKDLTYWQQKRIALARALLVSPRLLLLDEPCAGLEANERRDLAGLIGASMYGADRSIVIVEHDLEFIVRLCSRLVVMSLGRKIADGDPAAVLASEDVRRAYLGEE